MDHDTTATDINSSGTIARMLHQSAWGRLAVTGTRQYSKHQWFPDGVGLPRWCANRTKLVAMGVGPRRAAVGKTMGTTPLCSDQNQQYYGRYIAIFALYTDGTPATLQKVVDCLENTTEGTTAEYRSTAAHQTAAARAGIGRATGCFGENRQSVNLPLEVAGVGARIARLGRFLYAAKVAGIHAMTYVCADCNDRSGGWGCRQHFPLIIPAPARCELPC